MWKFKSVPLICRYLKGRRWFVGKKVNSPTNIVLPEGGESKERGGQGRSWNTTPKLAAPSTPPPDAVPYR